MKNTIETDLFDVEAIYQCCKKIPKYFKENTFEFSKEIEKNPEFIKFKNYIDSLLELENKNYNEIIKEILQKDLFEDTALNFISLLFWIKENELTPVEKLSENEAKTVIAIYGSLTNKEIEKIFEDIKPAPVEDIFKKINVQNKAQLIFKITLLKPYIWSLDNFKNIIDELKNLNS